MSSMPVSTPKCAGCFALHRPPSACQCTAAAGWQAGQTAAASSPQKAAAIITHSMPYLRQGGRGRGGRGSDAPPNWPRPLHFTPSPPSPC